MAQKRLAVMVDAQLHREAKVKAYNEGKTLKEKVIELLKGWIQK